MKGSVSLCVLYLKGLVHNLGEGEIQAVQFTIKYLLPGCKALDKQTEGILDEDGLPQVGAKLKEGDPFYR